MPGFAPDCSALADVQVDHQLRCGGWAEVRICPTYPERNIPWKTPNQKTVYVSEFLNNLGFLGIPAICSKGMLGFS